MSTEKSGWPPLGDSPSPHPAQPVPPPWWKLAVIAVAGVAVIVCGLRILWASNWIGLPVLLVGCQMMIRPADTHVWLEKLLASVP